MVLSSDPYEMHALYYQIVDTEKPAEDDNNSLTADLGDFDPMYCDICDGTETCNVQTHREKSLKGKSCQTANCSYCWAEYEKDEVDAWYEKADDGDDDEGDDVAALPIPSVTVLPARKGCDGVKDTLCLIHCVPDPAEQ